ncbi:retention module-containing protein, partial [Comamonas aquatica]
MATITVLVTKLVGQAWVRASDGSLTVLKEGMRIAADAELVTASGSSVQLQADGMPLLTVGENQQLTLAPDLLQPPQAAEAAVLQQPLEAAVNDVITALNAGQDPLANLDPTAATLAGGGGGSGATFVRLSSVLESTNPLGLDYPVSTAGVVEQPPLAGGTAAAAATAAAEDVNDPPVITVTAKEFV